MRPINYPVGNSSAHLKRYTKKGIIKMITCYLNYTIDPKKINEFEHYAKLWIPLVNKLEEPIMVISFHQKELIM